MLYIKTPKYLLQGVQMDPKGPVSLSLSRVTLKFNSQRNDPKITAQNI